MEFERSPVNICRCEIEAESYFGNGAEGKQLLMWKRPRKSTANSFRSLDRTSVNIRMHQYLMRKEERAPFLIHYRISFQSSSWKCYINPNFFRHRMADFPARIEHSKQMISNRGNGYIGNQFLIHRFANAVSMDYQDE